jgi:uncharacterized protein (TIGR02453 family)
MAAKVHFTKDLFEFLSDLDNNNNREWFQDNKDRYRDSVQEPLLAFIADVAEHLRGISPHFLADPRPSGGSMFRIYRDVRFSRNKSPYKTHAAAQFRHREGRDVHAPGFYLHLEPDNVFVGLGLWHPAGATLAGVRNAIVDRPNEWASVISDRSFTKHHSIGGDTLKRAPRGFDPDHPQIEHLNRKDFVAYENLTQKDALSPGFMKKFTGSCKAAAPFMKFLTEAVGLDFD